MAALALAPCALGASSFCGQKVSVKASVAAPKRAAVRLAAPRAKYGDESVYFDLKDVGNSTGFWDMYGQDGPAPYNGLQSKFFETFAGVFTKRGILLKFLVLGGAGTLGYFGATSEKDLLPIKNGPQQTAKPGPKGKL